MPRNKQHAVTTTCCRPQLPHRHLRSVAGLGAEVAVLHWAPAHWW